MQRVALVLFLLSVTLLAAAQAQNVLNPGPELQKLHVFVGNWGESQSSGGLT